MAKVGVWALVTFVWLCGFFTAKAFAMEHVYTKAEILAMVEEPVSGRVEKKPIVQDVTPKTNCQKGTMNPVGFGHQETTICLDGATGLKDMVVSDGDKKVYWKGNPDIGYYRLREDGSIDTSHWRSSVQGVMA